MDHPFEEPSSSPFCTRCGGEAAPEWRFCMHCGSRVGARPIWLDRRSWTEVGLGLAVAVALFMASRHTSGPVTSTSLNWSPTSTVQLTVPAGEWIDTGIVVPPGASVTIHASGLWNPWEGVRPPTGPDGIARSEGYDRMCPAANWGALVGQVGADDYVAVNGDATVSSAQGGELRLGMNDDFDSGSTGDNTGSLEVTISGAFSQVASSEAIPFPRGNSGAPHTEDTGP